MILKYELSFVKKSEVLEVYQVTEVFGTPQIATSYACSSQVGGKNNEGN